MSVLKKVTVGIEKFKELIQQNKYYVDKTSFIKNITDENVALFTRPRRFGKTLTMSMLKYFFEMNYENPSDISTTIELFKDLDISKDAEFCKKYMGQYPVIFLSLKDAWGDNFAVAISEFAQLIYDEWMRFEFVINAYSNFEKKFKQRLDDMQEYCYAISNKKFTISPEEDCSNITNSLKLLTQALKVIFNKNVIVIIDEYDVPLEKSRGKYYESMVKFIKKLFSATFKSNFSLEKGFLTGCLRVSRESIFTGLNNIPVYDCAKTEYSELFGFTNNDVAQMLDYYNLSDKFDTIKEWYDGYEIGKSEIYNPYSVNTYIKELLSNRDAIADCAWKNSSSNDFLLEFVNYLPSNEIDDFKNLLDGNTINKELNTTLNYGDLEKHNTTDLWSMLYSTGYLTKVGNPSEEDDTFVLRIPNKEVKKCFNDKILAYFGKSSPYSEKSKALIGYLINHKTNDINKLLDSLLYKYFGLRDINASQEYAYHKFLIGLLTGIGVDFESQAEVGDGYPDITLVLNDSETNEDIGIVLELKRAPSDKKSDLIAKCNEALKQCHDKKYYQDFIDGGAVQKIYLYGMAFCKRSSFTKFEEIKL